MHRQAPSSSEPSPRPSSSATVDLTPPNDEPVLSPVAFENTDSLAKPPAVPKKSDRHLPTLSRQNPASSALTMSSPPTASTEFPELPPAPPSKQYGAGYSAMHPVPTVQHYQADQKAHAAEADEYARIVAARRGEQEARERETDRDGNLGQADDGKPAVEGDEANAAKTQKKQTGESQGGKGPANEKQRLMDQMNANKVKPTDRIKNAEKGERRVRDPITGGEIIVKDADPKDFDVSRAAQVGSNILFHQFPPPRPASVDTLLAKLKALEYGSAVALVVVWVSVAFGSGFWQFAWRSILCGAVGFGLMAGMSVVGRGLEKEVERVRQDMHRQRGEAFSPPTPESVEWLNGLVKLIWGLVDPSIFVSVADMVEDILQQSLPGFVDAVRITDLGQGSNPIRITSIRALPDQPGDEGYPKDGWINEGNPQIKSKDTAGKDIEEDQAGDYYNFECAFSYAALPGQGAHLRAKNIHLLIEFFLGLYDWFHIPSESSVQINGGAVLMTVPIWIQVEQIFGVVRLRVQFITEPPFVRNLTFALVGVPSVEVSAVPMSERLPNVLDLPFISSFVKMGIAAGTAELAVPKSMTLNLQEMLSGAAVGDTRAIGVFIITIHYCEDLSAQDNNGKSDPYVVLAYAKFGKPLYSTRIITGDLNPVFEETAMLLLTMDEVKSKEDLSAMLWDNDKASADDLVGRVQIPVDELMKTPNKMIRRTDKLHGFEDANDMPGTLHWSIGYFEKAPLLKELERAPTADEAKAAPAPTKTAPEMEMSPYDQAPHPAKKDLPPPPPDVQKTKPDPEWPSGVLSVILHQVNNLERQNLAGASGDREGEAGQDTDEPSEQSDNLPSGYGEVLINDDLVYKSRVKQYTTNPYFEAGTEVFVRDWQNTVVRVVIRDSRLRENDPILGIVSLRLSEVFAEASSVTQTYALVEGVGFGKASISLAFRGVRATLPPNLRGWDTGTLELADVAFTADATGPERFDAQATGLRIITSESVEAAPKKAARVEGDTVSWDMDRLRMPVYSRYQSSVVFELGRSGALAVLGKGHPDAIAVLWLQDLTDDTEQDVTIPVFVGQDLGTLRLNVINDQTAKHHDFQAVGSIKARIKLDSGLDEDHDKLRLSQSRRHALEAYDHIEGEAKLAEKQAHYDDDGVIDKQEKRDIDRAHKRQLESRGRGLAQVKAYRQAKWMLGGVKDRVPIGKKKAREPTVQTEA
ncbi:hypothetical protein Q5752_005369 [Cryptotrichosporon argae]